jgi:hypothetical protein
MDAQNNRRQQSAETGAARSSNRSRSREREEQPPRRQLRSATRVAAVIQAAYGDNPHSISRLHDDELLCVLPFLALPDLVQFVRCIRRFNNVVRKERSRGEHLDCAAAIVPSLLSSSLGHHISCLWLERRTDAEPAVTRATLGQLRSLPQLTALRLHLFNEGDAAALVHRLNPETAVASFQAVLPTQLHSFNMSFSPMEKMDALSDSTRPLFSFVLSAAAVMPQLTELNIRCKTDGKDLHVRFDALAQLPHLRKLSMFGVHWADEQLAELKQLSPLRELHTSMSVDAHIQLFQPPHSLQLERIRLDITVDERVMHALLDLPTLTDLQPACLLPAAWPLLPQLPLLRCLRLCYVDGYGLTTVHTTLLSTALSGCHALTDLTLVLKGFLDENRYDLTDEQQEARWTELLGSVPQLRRLHVCMAFILPLLAVLPPHLPHLAFLKLSTSSLSKDVVPRLAHPTLQKLALSFRNLNDCHSFDKTQLQQLLRSPRLPQLASCRTH